MNLSPQNKAKLIQYFPELRSWFDERDRNEEEKNKMPQEVITAAALIAKIKQIKGEKGDKGDKGDTGRDYRTDEGFNEMLKKVTPVKGVHYRDGKDGRDGRNGKDGKDGKTGERGLDGIGIQGRAGRDGRDGKDASKADIKEVIKPFDKKIEDGMAKIDGRIKLIDQRWGSHGGGLSKVSTDSTLTGLGTASSPLSVVGSAGGSGYQAPLSGGFTGTNTWTTAPKVLVIDGVSYQKVQTDGTVMWTGTTTTVLTNAPLPTFDIFASASVDSGGSSSYQSNLSGGLTGTNVWTTAPNVLVIDGVPYRKVQTDGTIMWTIVGLTTTLVNAPLPIFDIFSLI